MGMMDEADRARRARESASQLARDNLDAAQRAVQQAWQSIDDAVQEFLAATQELGLKPKRGLFGRNRDEWKVSIFQGLVPPPNALVARVIADAKDVRSPRNSNLHISLGGAWRLTHYVPGRGVPADVASSASPGKIAAKYMQYVPRVRPAVVDFLSRQTPPSS